VSERDRFAAYRERLRALGFHPSRRLGQNFLLEPELHRLIADAAEVGGGDVVIEVGAGLGFLTRELARRARAVLAVEIDARLGAVLREEVGAMAGGERVEVVLGDALGARGELAAPLSRAMTDAEGPVKVVANLPYAVTGPVLAALCTAPRLASRLALLVQLEVAARLAAAPATSEYGGLSALVQSCYQVRLVRRVGREVFRPRPNVDSGVVQLVAEPDRPAAGWPASDRQRFAAFLRALFSSRRKMLRQAVAKAAAATGLAPPEARMALGAEWQTRRPGDLDPAMLAELWRRLTDGRGARPPDAGPSAPGREVQP